MIRMNDFCLDSEELVCAELDAVKRVLRSGWYILGEEVRHFESEWSVRCGTTYAIGTGNGLDAIEIGIRALGVTSGDEIITTPMTAFATVLGIMRAGATPVLADIVPETGLLDPASVERCLTTRTKAILLVHLYGQIHDMRVWLHFSAKHGIPLIEDCAQAHLAQWEGRVAGTFGAWGAYSFYPTKNLGAAGDAGALVTNDKSIAELARMMRNYGQSNRYEHSVLGLNSRLDEIHAAILRAKLTHLDGVTKRRRAIAARYRRGIDNPHVRLLSPPLDEANHVYHLFVIVCEERDRLKAFLHTHGIEAIIHYPIPAHLQPTLSNARRDSRGLPNCERHARTCLSIPCHPNMTDGEVDAVIKALNDFR